VTGAGSAIRTTFSITFRLKRGSTLTSWPVKSQFVSRWSIWTGKNHSGETPGLRTESRGGLVTYLTDVRGARVVILQVTWFELPQP
jgi:hypothetical protein